MIKTQGFALGLLLLINSAHAGIDDYNVVWDSPSEDHKGSMPLGNGDIGLNAWMEPNGDLCFYISHTDTWSENGRLLKVGRVRLSLSPSPLTSDAKFKQTLNLQTGEILIDIEGDNPTRVKLWVDANNPLIVCETESQNPVKATAKIELWRTERVALPKVEIGDHRARFPKKMAEEQDMTTYVEPDTLLEDLKGGIGWYHRNERSDGPTMSMEFQGLKEFIQTAEYTDPLLHRIFGAVIKSEGGQVVDDETLVSKSAKKQRVTVAVNVLHPATTDEWLAANDDIFLKAANTKQNDQAHKQWWADFWQRSHLSITQNAISKFKGAKEDDAFIVSRGYNLQRFINACGARGHFPVKFNGSIFNLPEEGQDPDWRKLGAAYWWQNSRLAYASMCSSGDFDLIKPLFRFYIDDIYPANKYRTKKYFDIDGAYFLEMYSPWGGSPMGIYGWDKPMEDREDPLQINRFHKWEWVAGPELVFMMLEYYAYTGDEELLQEIIPIGKDVASFFKGYYKLDEKGIMHMYPSQALESWWECTNPMPEVSALHAMTDQFTELSSKLSPEDRTFWKELKKIIPELPIRDTESGKALAPAEKFADRRNIESPEMSAVFPFRQIAIGKPNLELGINALKHRWDRGHVGWRRSSIYMAYLGLAEQAQGNLIKRASQRNRHYRFPAMWGPNYDWLPDQTHGGVLTTAAQSMLMQTDGKEIHLLPAWPKNWDANFKLHAPYGTTVEASVKEGKITDLKVTPELRKKDIIIHAAQN